jgi:hypothetical protein
VRLEKGETLRPRTLEAIRTTLESAGTVVVLAGLYEGDGGLNVRFAPEKIKD